MVVRLDCAISTFTLINLKNNINLYMSYPVAKTKNQVERYIISQKAPTADTNKLIEYLRSLELNILITGATGSGKSSTINALFNIDKAKVGIDPDPETFDIQKFELDGLILWDTPGLGDDINKDKIYSRIIKTKLLEKKLDGTYLIDLVLVIVDGSTRDFGTSYEIINNVVLPNLGKNPSNRVIVAINQADIAMKGREGWNYEENCPTSIGKEFLDKKVLSVSRRIEASTGININPIYYSAGYKDRIESLAPYNLIKLLSLIVTSVPTEKRVVFRNNTITAKQDNWKYDDKIEDYGKKTRDSMTVEVIAKVAVSLIGGIFGFFFG